MGLDDVDVRNRDSLPPEAARFSRRLFAFLNLLIEQGLVTMPLPPAPTRRAALLAPEAFNAAPRDAVAAPQMDDAAVTPSAPRKTTRRKAAAPAAEAMPAVQASPAVVIPASPSARTTRSRKETTATKPAPVAAPSTVAAPKPVVAAKPASKARASGPAKLFVLDTNVLLHDPTSLFRFEEHDIFLPMIVLEELDSHKKGMTEVARNGRQVSRTLDALVATQGADMVQGIRLDATGQRAAGGKLFFQTAPLNYQLPTSLPQGKADNQILGVVEALRTQFAPREVVLVSKDINMRVKARALGLAAEDYQNDKALEDGDLLYSGVQPLPTDFWSKAGKNVESWQSGAHTYYRVGGPVVAGLMINQFVYFEAPGEPSLFARVSERFATRPWCSKRSRTTATPRTRSGA
jgi:PhoH-like ATPase